MRTVLRNRDWADEVAFYRRTVAAFPDFPHAHLNLGDALLRRNRLPEALEATQAAVRLSPTYPDPYINLGLIYWRQGDEVAAIRHFQLAAVLAEHWGNPLRSFPRPGQPGDATPPGGAPGGSAGRLTGGAGD